MTTNVKEHIVQRMYKELWTKINPLSQKINYCLMITIFYFLSFVCLILMSLGSSLHIRAVTFIQKFKYHLNVRNKLVNIQLTYYVHFLLTQNGKQTNEMC